MRAPGWIGTGVVVLALLSGCSPKAAERAGADPSRVGPAETATTVALPTATPSPTATPPPASATRTGPAAALQTTLAAAITVAGRADTGLSVTQQKFAGNQIDVTWRVSNDPADPAAKPRLRTDVRTILRTIRSSHLTYGSVLLTSNAEVATRSGAGEVLKVLRVKYSRALIKRTDFRKISSARLFAIADDKPAEINPAFR